MEERGHLKRSLDEKEEPKTKMTRQEGSGLGSRIKDSDMKCYQLEGYEAALRRNTIVWLEKGSGKTMIAIMLMKEIARQLRGGTDKRLIIFVAPTVDLVHQQCSVIKIQTDLHADEYYGAKGIDDWDLRCWQKEAFEKEVMVMTPQILLDALRNAFITLDMVRLLIFDECHRATGNHPYTRIMSEYYHKTDHKPKVFGMTASPVIRKGVSSAEDCQYQISELEEILDSKVFILEDRNELEVHVSRAKEIKRYYSSWFVNEDLKGELNYLWTKFDTTAAATENPIQKQLMGKALRTKLSCFHGKILYCLETLGILCAYEAVKECMQRDGAALDVEENACPQTPHILLSNYLKEALHIFKGHLSAEACDVLETEANLDPVYMNFISPKLSELMNMINALRNQKQVLCMIFVERTITAKVTCWLIKKLKFLSDLSCDYLTGNTSAVNGLTAKRQRMIMDSFREGKVNLLLTTDVAEEGIDVHNCSCVIRFDLPKSVRSYVQSRGRARYADSLYVLMLERGNEGHKDLLFEIFGSERAMQDATSSRDTSAVLKSSFKNDAPVYTVSSTGATVTPDSSISLIFSYCQKLPGDKIYQPKPEFHYDLSGDFSECTLTLPPNAAFRHLKGPPAKNNNLAKKLVCLDACKKLHEMKALDDHLLPINEQLPDQTLAKEENSAPGAGTTRRKELHGSAIADALSGTWANVPASTTLQAYNLFFSCNIIKENYPGFIFLVKEELDEDVAHVEIDLFLHNNKVVKAHASPCGQVCLDTDQLTRSKAFHELFFNGLFGKLYHISKSSGVRTKTLAMGNTALWPSTNMYMILPMSQQCAESKASPSIDWKIIDSCFSAAEFLKANHFPMTMNNFHMEAVHKQDNKKPEKIHLVNASYGFHELKDMVVLAAHTGLLYCVTDLVNDATADSPFDGSCNSARPSYISYTDYFKKKYGINLRYSAQPLLRVKQSHNPHNLLSKKGGCLNINGKSDPLHAVSEQQGHVHMPPELLIKLEASRDLLRSLYLLPSVVHRIEAKILASQLRRAICFRPSCHQIPVDLILEALTTRRCAEDFSLERLELLGDSVLKYVVSCNLFLKYPEKHEGQLSAFRSLAVRNATLHRLATGCKLQNYIRDAPFDAPRWLAPGQRITRPVPCECGVDLREVQIAQHTDVENSAIKIGVTCDLGHRWLCSKTISDCLEALIGAYYIGGGLEAARWFMAWVGIDCEHDQALVEEAIRKTSRFSYTKEDKNMDSLESKLGYKFLNRGLLLEAITHASQQEAGSGCCYQRLEFLGDSVLDLLITWHLFESHKDIDQGELTDLRSASVNNEKFAQASVKYNLQPHLLHGSELLLMQIKDYVKFLKSFPENVPLPTYNKSKGPKVLGDLVESIAGAILIDSKLNLGEVWRVFKPILSPFPTPEDLQLHPLRELGEICGEAGSPLCTEFMKDGEQIIAKLTVQLKDGPLIAEGCDKIKNIALEQAALLLLDAMEKKGISHKRSIWRGKAGRVQCILSCLQKQTTGPSPVGGHHNKHGSTRLLDPTISKVPIDMKKGGPRTSLFQLCKDMNWVRPTFEPRASGLRFISKVILHMPDSDNIEVEGEEKTDKKSAMDSAALVLLYKLGELGKCIVEEC